MLEPCFQLRIATSSPLCAFDYGIPNQSFPYTASPFLYGSLCLTELVYFASSVPERKRYVFLLLNGFIQVFLFVLELSWQLSLTGELIGS